ncbi:tripartite tricarboxylate transporter substrate binding protein [Variovorax sp. 770b2]|uniref:Bug family tripartite tricarboxylate transporter substrate binding protein n=1 Tax=Variovorax sp. 770b2 TaxID=1566271 RepID=UPI0008EDEA15|nr:tripartite tricarboxylate transporter substrate binding protein [Variovorax sp. 770b2]SFP58486.1 Tripartite-type tricarboxylate transporter, receptor component TctC [Variovorax sp. 770b2]
MRARPDWRALFLAAGLLLGTACAAAPQAYTIVVPAPPGGPIDRVARLLAPDLAAALGHPVVVDNRLGAAGKIGVQAALRAPRDGHTLIAVSPSIASVNPVVDKAPGYDPLADFDALGIAATNAGVVAVRAGLPVADMAELVHYAKAHPGELTYGSFGIGTSLHLQSEELLHTLGIDARHIPYKGEAQVMAALAGGEVDLMLYATAPIVPLVQSGRVRALAATSSQRWAMLPQVPSYAETGLPALRTYQYRSWVGFVLPTGTPAADRQAVLQAWQRTLASPKLRESLTAQGFEPASGDPADMQRTVAGEIGRLRALLASGRITLD